MFYCQMNANLYAEPNVLLHLQDIVGEMTVRNSPLYIFRLLYRATERNPKQFLVPTFTKPCAKKTSITNLTFTVIFKFLLRKRLYDDLGMIINSQDPLPSVSPSVKRFLPRPPCSKYVLLLSVSSWMWRKRPVSALFRSLSRSLGKPLCHNVILMWGTF